MNLSVGLSVSLQGFGLQVAKGDLRGCKACSRDSCVWAPAGPPARHEGWRSSLAGTALVPPVAHTGTPTGSMPLQHTCTAWVLPLQACWASCRLEPSAWWGPEGELSLLAASFTACALLFAARTPRNATRGPDMRVAIPATPARYLRHHGLSDKLHPVAVPPTRHHVVV